MRLKTLTARTMGEAMDAVRRDLGEDAIIVSTESSLKGVTIVAAVEEAAGDQIAPAPRRTKPVGDPVDTVHEALRATGVPPKLAERLVDLAFLSGLDAPLPALEAALNSLLGFQPLGPKGPVQPILLVGTPGAGKTMAAAKLAARAARIGRPTRLVTCDVVRAGAVEQLAAFTRILELPLAVAEQPADLRRALAATVPGELVIIDTAGVNPFAEHDMTELASLVRAVPAEPVLVLAAGSDPHDAADQARLFSGLGVARLLPTRLDTTRRLGGLIAAAVEHELAFADCSAAPSVADGLEPLDAGRLARRLLPALAAQPDARALEGVRS